MLDDNPINDAGDIIDDPDLFVQNVNISLTVIHVSDLHVYMTCNGGCDAVLNDWFPPKLLVDSVGCEEFPNAERVPM